MLLLKALYIALDKFIDIQTQAVQNMLVNLISSKLANFFKNYWVVLIVISLLYHPQNNNFSNIYQNVKTKIASPTLGNIEVKLEIPFLNVLQVQVNIKSLNKHNFKFAQEINQIITMFKNSYIDVSYCKKIKKTLKYRN